MSVNDFLFPNLPVWFYPDGDTSMAPHIGFVTRINPSQTVQLIKFAPGWKDGRTFDGVRHVSDPKAKDPVLMKDSGSWDHTPLTKFLIEMFGKDLAAFLNPSLKKEPAKK